MNLAFTGEPLDNTSINNCFEDNNNLRMPHDICKRTSCNLPNEVVGSTLFVKSHNIHQ